ncbi:Rne/Rng family ribonuclease [Intrasporangium sp. DVR]|uniref:Rne/Rng family ribonuclease n=1 Tax=Intrasporangium sp. DVR TaxID=3127867 RepID=UPI00313A5B4B
MAPNDTTPTDSRGDSGEERATLFEGATQTTPYAAEPVPDAAAAPAGRAPRKRAPRRATKAATTAMTAPDPTAEEPAGEPAPAPVSEDDTPVAAPARKRAARKAAAPRKRAKKAEAETQDVLESVALTEAAAPVDAAATSEEEPDTEEPAEADEAAPAPPVAAVIPSFSVLFQPPDPAAALAAPTRRRRRAEAPAVEVPPAEPAEDLDREPSEPEGREDEPSDEGAGARRSRRRRGGKGRRGRGASDVDENESEGADDEAEEATDTGDGGMDEESAGMDGEDESGEDEEGASSRRRRRRRRAGSGSSDATEDAPNVSTRVRQPRVQSDEPLGVKGSTRLEAKKQRRREGREAGRRRTVITEAEFLARREAVDRIMVVRNKDGRTQMGVLEDGVLVEHYIDQATNVSMAGNIYLGRVQNVLPSMEAAFVDIGKGRNAVLYAGEVNWDAAGLEANEPKRIENALSSGQTVLVQVTKDPIGHKGARLTSQISLPGRYLVYVPNSSMTGISRKLPDTERTRLKKILREVVPDSAGVIVRTAAEGASEEELRADVERLSATWEDIQARAEGSSTPKAGKSKGRKKNGGTGSSPTGSAPLLLHGEPDLTVRVIRDVFNEDFKELVVSGDQAWNEIHPYISSVAPDLADRVTRWTGEEDLFSHHRVDEQLAKAMDRKVWLPSGGSLVIDRTEAMTVVDVNTGKFVGSGGNLEETVTKNNLEAAEEIVRQLRLRDIGGIIVIDFIDMVLESNRELVVRRLLECLGRDRTKHQVAEVTSLGLVQMTRKRVGSGLIEVFSETCEHCNGRGYVIHSDPVGQGSATVDTGDQGGARSGRRARRGASGGSNSGSNTGSNSGSKSGSNTPTPTPAPAEPSKPAGPTAAQIAAAAHAAALKSAAATTAPEGEGDEADAAQHHPEQVDHVDQVDQVGQVGRVEREVERTDVDRREQAGAQPEAEARPGAEQAVVESPAMEAPHPVVEPAPEVTAAPTRRRRGRVVAPAGPPRTSSTEA